MRTINAGRGEIVTLPFPKDPADRLLYRMDWTPFLAPLSDTIATSAWDAGDLTADADAIEAGNLSATVWIEGGTAGTTYAVANRITTAAGRIVERSFRLRVEER
jgi:hypothetical protein